VATSAFAILRWDDYKPALVSVGDSRPDVQLIGSMVATMLLGIVPLNGAAFAAADWEARRTLKDPSLGRRPVPPLLVALAAAGVALLLANVPVPLQAPPPALAHAGPPRILARTAVVLVAFFVTSLYALRLLYRRTGSPQFALMSSWLFLTWLVPMGVDTVQWYLSTGRPDVLGTASSFSPLGALIELWTGHARVTNVGLVFQGCLAALMAAAFHITGRPPPAALTKPGPASAEPSARAA
jgi:hypothetical protein